MRRKHKINIGFAVKAGDQIISEAGLNICMAEGCLDTGTHPAPKNRQELRSHIWFCLDHIRMFNSQWNYYDGLEGDALEREIRRATTWERPSWKFGTAPSAKIARSASFEDTRRASIAANNLPTYGSLGGPPFGSPCPSSPPPLSGGPKVDCEDCWA